MSKTQSRVMTGAIETPLIDREIQKHITNGWRIASDKKSTGWLDGSGDTRTVVLVRESEGK